MRKNYGYEVNDFEVGDIVLVRNFQDDKWRLNHYSHYDPLREDDCNYICGPNGYRECIPYEGNEHLLKLIDSPSENNGNNSLFGIRLKPGYKIEFINKHYLGNVFRSCFGLGVIFCNKKWMYVDDIEPDKVKSIKNKEDNLLWLSSSKSKVTENLEIKRDE